MNKNRSSGVCCALLAIAAFVAANPAMAAQVSRDILNAGTVVALSNPSAAQDADGNIHIAAQGDDPATPGANAGREIYYMLVRPSGTVLIDATQVSIEDTAGEGRPQIAVTAGGKAVITWANAANVGTATPLAYVLVDPSGDDQDGDAAVPADILEVTEVNRGVVTGSGHHALALDAAGRAQVVRTSGDNLYYLSFDYDPADGLAPAVVAEVLKEPCESRTAAAMDLDSDGNLHVVCAHNGVNGNGPASYFMLNGATGAVMIDATQLFEGAVSPHAAHFSLFVDSNDLVHIVYGDKRNTVDADDWCNECSQAGTAIYTRLDPSRDDQNGDAALIGTIKLGDEVEMGNLWYGRAFLDDGRIRLIGANGKGGNLTHISIAKGGTSPSSSRTVDAQLASRGWSRHYVTGAGERVIWSEGVFNTPLVNGTYQLVMSSFGSFAGGGGGGGGSPGLPLLVVFGLAGLLRLARK